MSKKQILFMIESLDLGGAEKSLVTLLNNLDYSLYDVTLLLIKKEGVFNKFVPEDVNIIYFNIFKNTSFIITKIISRITFFVRRKMNIKYNTAHLFWESFGNLIPRHKPKYEVAIAYSQGFATYFIADKVNANRKYTWLNIDYIHAKHKPSFDYDKYVQYNKIVCVSEESKISLDSAMNIINKSLSTIIIKDITDKRVVEQMSKEDNGFRNNDKVITLLTVGRLAKQKGLELAIESCKNLKKKGRKIKWYIIGEGSERIKLEKRIKMYNIQDEMILMGYKENPYAYMRTCDIYVQTSIFEGLGLTVIEAAILNKPIVCTNFPTASSIIKHNETGLICEMSAEAISDSIEQYIKNKELVKKVTQNLHKTVNNDKEISLRKINDLLS